jgi:hypothetical protein
MKHIISVVDIQGMMEMTKIATWLGKADTGTHDQEILGSNIPTI